MARLRASRHPVEICAAFCSLFGTTNRFVAAASASAMHPPLPFSHGLRSVEHGSGRTQGAESKGDGEEKRLLYFNVAMAITLIYCGNAGPESPSSSHPSSCTHITGQGYPVDGGFHHSQRVHVLLKTVHRGSSLGRAICPCAFGGCRERLLHTGGRDDGAQNPIAARKPGAGDEAGPEDDRHGHAGVVPGGLHRQLQA